LIRRRRRCIKRSTLMPKVLNKLRIKPHLSRTSISSKGVRWVKALIICISLLKRSGTVALSSLGTRMRGFVWVKSFFHLLHILLKFLPSLSLFMKSCLNGMVRTTCQPGTQTSFSWERTSHSAGRKTVPDHPDRSDQYTLPV
jgi:hypothetical protein